jgi:hypothetical protein
MTLSQRLHRFLERRRAKAHARFLKNLRKRGVVLEPPISDPRDSLTRFRRNISEKSIPVQSEGDYFYNTGRHSWDKD